MILYPSCKTKQLTPDTPTVVQIQNPNRPLSSLNVPVQLPLLAIENAINTQFSGTLYEDLSYDNNDKDNLIVKVTKIAPIQMTGEGDKLRVILPLEIYVKGRIKKDFFSLFDENVGIQQEQAATFRIDASLTSKLGIGSDWTIQSKTESDFSWREKPYIEIGPVKIPIASVTERIIRSQLGTVNTKIDAEIGKYLNVQPLAQKYWSMLQDPIKVAGLKDGYLLIKPEFIALSGFQMRNKQMQFNLSFRSDLSLVTKDLLTSSNKVPLPKLQTQQRPDSTFRLYFGAMISYSSLTALLSEQLAGKTYKFENGLQQITINSVELQNYGQKVLMVMDVEGFAVEGIFKKRFKGKIFASGMPYYDQSSQDLKVRDFDFDVKSKDAILNAAEWLLKGNFKKQIQAQLQYPIGKDLEEARKSAELAINGMKQPQFEIKTQISEIVPYGIEQNKQYMHIIMQANGTAKLLIKKL